MSLLDNLNQEQRAAAECVDGPVLIFAGAGSGKTRALTYRIAHMIGTCGINPREILAVTFTNKAANEMRERIHELVAEERASGIWAGTFHSICARILRVDGSHVGLPPEYSIYDESDQSSVIKEIRARLDIKLSDSDRCTDRKNNEVSWAISEAKNQLLTPAEYQRTAKGRWERLVARIYIDYQRQLERNNAVDFDDLIMKTVALLENYEEVRRKYQERFRYVLVDEYQDINFAQFRLVEMIAQEHKNLCVVGDDDQSIYGWRGADVGIILEFQERFPEAQVVKLERNYRSTAKIIEVANCVIQQNKTRAEKSLWTANPPGDNIVIYQAVNEEEEAEWIAEMIATQVSAGFSTYGDYAILYRVNAASRNFEQALATRRIPYEVVGGLRFLERAEVKNAIAYLRAVHNPEDDLSLRRIINTPPRGIGDATVEELTRISERDDLSLCKSCRIFAADEDQRARARTAVGDFFDMMMILRQRAEAGSLSELVRSVVHDSGMREYFQRSGTAEHMMRLENLQEFVSMAASFERRRPDSGLQDFLEHIALISDIDQADELTGSVSLMTLHSAKGLQFPVVFMVAMEEGIFPHRRSTMTGDSREIEEERRLAYVGMTRAEKLLYISHAFHRTVFGITERQKASRFLDDLPEELLDRRERFGGTPQPRMLDDGDRVLEEPKGGRQIDVASILKSARDRDTSAEASGGSGRRKKGAAPPAPWKSGQRVRHAKFGDGVVVSAEAADNDWKVAVAFKNGGGVKKLLAGVAGLEKI